ncbi:DUF2384 domain-containing protein [Pseudomonas sp. OA3]|nr:DUF2384 domain-containing protein [Pseudomonas sp. OA3]
MTPSNITERLHRIAAISLLAEEVFESSEVAAKWMGQPNRALGGKTPTELCDTEAGAAQVRRILQAMEWGGVV